MMRGWNYPGNPAVAGACTEVLSYNKGNKIKTEINKNRRKNRKSQREQKSWFGDKQKQRDRWLAETVLRMQNEESCWYRSGLSLMQLERHVQEHGKKRCMMSCITETGEASAG